MKTLGMVENAPKITRLPGLGKAAMMAEIGNPDDLVGVPWSKKSMSINKGLSAITTSITFAREIVLGTNDNNLNCEAKWREEGQDEQDLQDFKQASVVRAGFLRCILSILLILSKIYGRPRTDWGKKDRMNRIYRILSTGVCSPGGLSLLYPVHPVNPVKDLWKTKN